MYALARTGSACARTCAVTSNSSLWAPSWGLFQEACRLFYGYACPGGADTADFVHGKQLAGADDNFVFLGAHLQHEAGLAVGGGRPSARPLR